MTSRHFTGYHDGMERERTWEEIVFSTDAGKAVPERAHVLCEEERRDKEKGDADREG